MPSSPKIPKEMILKAALDLLIRDGYAAINIKALAKELGCSTQSISWHFGNMDGLRRFMGHFRPTRQVNVNAYSYNIKLTDPIGNRLLKGNENNEKER